MLGPDVCEQLQRRKKRSKQELSCQELREILSRVLKNHESHRDVAQLFNVKPALIMNLVRTEKLQRNQVSKVEQKRRAIKELRSKVKARVEEHLSGHQHIWTKKQIRLAVADKDGAEVSDALVGSVLKKHFGMSYRVLKRAAY